MTGQLIFHLCSQPMMQIIRGLLLNPGRRHLRHLARDLSLSPAGVSDVVRRLTEAGVLSERRIRNRRYLGLSLANYEVECLKQFFSIYESTAMRQRAVKFGSGAAEKLQWMDEAYEFFHELRKTPNDPA